MKRLFKLLIRPTYFFKMVSYNLEMIISKYKQNKTIVYNLHQDYFYDIFETIYAQLKTNPRLKIYFSYLEGNAPLKSYLENKIEKKYLISSLISPYINFDMYICPEVNGPNFPIHLFKTKKVEIYHGSGTYNLYSKADVLNKFDIHFAIGPKFNEFIDFAYKDKKRKPKIYNVGYPKLDILLRKNNLTNELRKLYKIDKRKTVLYAPHWNEFSSLHFFQEAFLKSLAKLDIQILIKPHNYLYTQYPQDNWLNRFEKLADNFENISFIKRPNTQELYPLADMMITDTGTTAALEFCIMGKPLLIYCNEAWFENNNHSEVERDLCNLAISFQSAEELNQKISLIIQNENIAELKNQKELQKEIVSKYLYPPGEGTSKAISAILTELELD